MALAIRSRTALTLPWHAPQESVPAFHRLSRLLERKLCERGGADVLYLEGWLWKRGRHTFESVRRARSEVLTANSCLRRPDAAAS